MNKKDPFDCFEVELRKEDWNVTHSEAWTKIIEASKSSAVGGGCNPNNGSGVGPAWLWEDGFLVGVRWFMDQMDITEEEFLEKLNV